MRRHQKHIPAATAPKPAATHQFSVVSNAVASVKDYDETRSGYGYVTWGRDNQFPDYLWSVYERCTTLQSAINTYVDFTIGDEIINKTPFRGENAVGDTLPDVVRKCATDLWVYGGFAVQVFYNQLGELLNVAYLDIARVRVNELGDKCYVVPDFSRYGRTTALRSTLEFDAFGKLTKEERAKVGSEVFFYKGQRSKGYYPKCDWAAAIVSAETQIEIKRFHYNNITHGMLSACVININGGENYTDEAKVEFERAFKDKFAGTENAGGMVISFNADSDHAVDIAKLEDDNFDAKFQQLAENTREDLFIALRANPQLLGLAVSSGLQTQEFQELYQTTERLCIRPKQNELQRVFNKIFQMGVIDDAIEFAPYSLGIAAAAEAAIEEQQQIEEVTE